MSGVVQEPFGETEQTFLLTLGAAEELEEIRAEALRKRGVMDPGQASIMVMFTRLAGGSWLIGDARSVLRLSLIGGGMARDEATRLVEREVKPGALTRCTVIAARVLEKFLDGDPDDQPDGGSGKAEGAAPHRHAAPTDDSGGVGSTDRAQPSA